MQRLLCGLGSSVDAGGHPIAFINNALAKRHLGMSVFEKRLLAIVHAVEKWRHYLLGRHFVLRTDHQSLKYLLEQRLHNDSQFRWLSRLIGFDYEIIVADALSRIQGPELLAITLSLD